MHARTKILTLNDKFTEKKFWRRVDSVNFDPRWPLEPVCATLHKQSWKSSQAFRMKTTSAESVQKGSTGFKLNERDDSYLDYWDSSSDENGFSKSEANEKGRTETCTIRQIMTDNDQWLRISAQKLLTLLMCTLAYLYALKCTALQRTLHEKVWNRRKQRPKDRRGKLGCGGRWISRIFPAWQKLVHAIDSGHDSRTPPSRR